MLGNELFYTARGCRLISGRVKVYAKFEHTGQYNGVSATVICDCNRADIEKVKSILDAWVAENFFRDVEIVNSTVDENECKYV